MRFLFASGELYPPAFRGGAECSIDEMARELVARGHACEVVVRLGQGASRLRYKVWRALTGASRVGRADGSNGYATYRAPSRGVRAALVERIEAIRPDLVLSWNTLAGALADDAVAAGVPAAIWVPDVTFRWIQGALPDPRVRLTAASRFLSERVSERLGRPTAVLRPLVRLEDYRCASRRPEFVTLVNPCVSKGVEVALDVAARLPDRRFLLVGPPPPPDERAAFEARCASLGNVVVEGPVRDMREVYARTAVLLVPSQCEDASPRVILEAHVNGIPVVASDRGGIPEVSGEASVLLPAAAPAERWAAEVERLLSEPAAVHRAARRSLENAARAELGPDAILASFLAIAREAGEALRAVPAGVAP